MKNPSAKPLSLAAIAALTLLVSCSQNSAAPSSTDQSSTSAGAASSVPSAADSTVAAPETSTVGSTVNPASTTTQKTPTTEPPKNPQEPSSSTTGTPPEQIATAIASSLQAAFGQGNFAPQYQVIWDKVQSSGGTITAFGSDAADPQNPSRPQAAAKYALTLSSTSFCITRTIDKVSNTATFQTAIAKC